MEEEGEGAGKEELAVVVGTAVHQDPVAAASTGCSKMPASAVDLYWHQLHLAVAVTVGDH